MTLNEKFSSLEQKLLHQLMLVQMRQTNKKATKIDKQVYLFWSHCCPSWYSSCPRVWKAAEKLFRNPAEKWTLANTINSNPISISRYEHFYYSLRYTFCLNRGNRENFGKWLGFSFMLCILLDFEKVMENGRVWWKVAFRMEMRFFQDKRKKKCKKIDKERVIM